MRLVWSGIQARKRLKPLVGAVRSCTAVSESFGTLQSPRCCSCQEPRPQSISRGFCFWSDRQGALANEPAWAAPKVHRPLLHPQQSRPALIERLVKPLVLRWKTRPAVKVNQSLKGTWS